ncbi:MAG TPA: hypothetical protein VGP33_18480 [Chloroflexota bacterium]|nr:hypothetical protein [Chloroflexota bacterium]
MGELPRRAEAAVALTGDDAGSEAAYAGPTAARSIQAQFLVWGL